MDGASFSIAFASAMVRLGRRIKVAKSAPEVRLTALTFPTKIVFGPSERIMSRSDESKPRMSDVIPTIDVMPITTPRTVNADRSLLPRRVSSAMRQTSPISPLFTTPRLDGVEPGGTGGRVGAEEQTDPRGDADPQNDGPEFELGRQRREAGDPLRRQEPQRDADQDPECGERHRFSEHLRHDVAPIRAKRLAQADFAGPFRHHHQHDVHD